MRTKITDLIGEDIAGKRAVTTQEQYYYQYPQGVPVRTMIDVVRRKRDGHFWVTMRWERDPKLGVSDCGFSGYREDTAGDPLTLEFVS